MMRLLVIRHGDAGDREEFAFTGRPDSERPLTREERYASAEEVIDAIAIAREAYARPEAVTAA